MISIRLMGGLGNQLFQIFTLIAYCLKCKKAFGFNTKLFISKYKKNNGFGERNTYWDNIFSNLKMFTSDINLPVSYGESNFTYKEIPLNLPDNTSIYGYYQSYKYFDEYTNNILSLVDFKNKSINTDFSKCVSLHFRIGDYKVQENIHPVADISYYDNALSCILKVEKIEKVIYFYEKDDEIDVKSKIDLLKEKYNFIEFSPCDHSVPDWEQMLEMSNCKHNIIANSSFSWWSAYLNSNVDKIVCYPNIWFGTSLKHDTSDMFPPTWNCIEY